MNSMEYEATIKKPTLWQDIVSAIRGSEQDYTSGKIGRAILVGILLSLPVSFLGLFFAPDLLQLMGASETIINSQYMYTTIMMSTNIVIMLIFIINAIFRGAGDAAIAMRLM